eukprot:GHVU01019952.1.p2 GENE.GHVU01019952.1~~GHVU01019952.1.p2  ORF type:complete len:302 (-),score=53.16 GHVU01019952.1:274-1179(-)
MTTLLQLALFSGALIGLGVALLILRFAPAQPDLTAAIDNLAPERALSHPDTTPPPASTQDRIGLWVMRTLPVTSWGRTPAKELAILRIPAHRFYGEKTLYGVIGLVLPAAATALVTLIGLHLPIFIPVAGSLLIGAALSFLPDYNVRSDAAAARLEFSRALGAYVDLVALERNAGSGSRQAMEQAATVGDSWVFKRIGEELARSRWSGVAPWDSLTSLSDELGLPELAEVSDIMRLSGEEGAAVYQTLRARSASMRAAMMNAELAKANATGERLSMPVAALAIVFLIILAVPAVLRVLFAV